MTVLTHVVPFGDSGAATASEALSPYIKIKTIPESVVVGAAFKLIVYAPFKVNLRWSHYQNWSKGNLYTGDSIKRSISPAEAFDEVINLGGATEWELTAPIADWGGVVMGGEEVVRVVSEDLEDLYNYLQPRLGRLSLRRYAWDSGPPLPGAYGTIRVQYTTYPAQVFELPGVTTAGEYLFWLSSPDQPAWSQSEVIQVAGQTDGSGPSGGPKFLIVQPMAYCSSLRIPDIDVWIDGEYIGKTDANGQIAAGLRASGEHSFKGSGDGYLPTDGDDLNNDSFTL